MDASSVVVLLLLVVAGVGIGLAIGSNMSQRLVVRYIRMRAVPAQGPPPFLSDLALEIERGEHLRCRS